MSAQGYLSDKREAQIAKILDASIDFNDLLKNKKKVLGVFSLGNFMERNDRKVFKALITILDDKLIGTNPQPEIVAAIEGALALLESKNFGGFSTYMADVLSEEIDTPFEGFEKQIFTSVLLMFNGLIGKAVEKIEEKIEQAELER